MLCLKGFEVAVVWACKLPVLGPGEGDPLKEPRLCEAEILPVSPVEKGLVPVLCNCETCPVGRTLTETDRDRNGLLEFWPVNIIELRNGFEPVDTLC